MQSFLRPFYVLSTSFLRNWYYYDVWSGIIQFRSIIRFCGCDGSICTYQKKAVPLWRF